MRSDPTPLSMRMKRTSAGFVTALGLILAWVLTCTLISDDPLWLIAPCVLLIAGYAALLGHDSHLGSRQIDTVYYLGFLTTLAVLGTAVFGLTRQGAATDPGSIRNAAAHFAVGLLATGVGLVARLLLQQRMASAEGVSETLASYADTMARLSDRMDEAVVKFEKLTEVTLKGASEASRRSAEATFKIISEGLTPVASEIAHSVARVNDSLRQLDGEHFRLLSDSVKGLDSSMGRLSHGLQSAEEAVHKYRAELDASAQAHQQQALSGEELAASCHTMAAGLAALLPALQGIDLALRSYQAEVSKATALQGSYVTSTGQALTELQSNTVGVTRLVFEMARKMAELSQAAAGVDPESLRTLGVSLQVAVSQLNTLGAEVERFAHTIRISSSAVAETHLQELSIDFKRQGDLVRQAAHDLGQAMVHLSCELGTAIQEGLRH